MKAVGFNQPGNPDALQDIELDTPQPGPRDLLVAVEAVSVNPIDTKLRQRPLAEAGFRVLGFDAVGTVTALGSGVQHFKVGDRVWYAGSMPRQGSNAELQCVDERLAAAAPANLSAAEGAALPLTALTAWEALEDQLGFKPDQSAGRSLLVIGGAGGVGSIAIQLATRLFGLRVIATAGREESKRWCENLGADATVDYRQPLAPQLETLRLKQVDAILVTQDLDTYWQQACQLIAPLGGICAIVDAREPLDLNPLKPKSARFCWEFMFTRALFGQQMERQGEILSQLAQAVEAGSIRSTLTETLGPISAANLVEAHRRIETGRTIGKLALAGWAS